MKRLNKAERRMRHLENVAALIGETIEETKPIYHQLRSIEYSGHRLAERYCNGEIDSYQYDVAIDLIKEKVRNLLPPEIFREVSFNGDPRGYFLKLNDEWMRLTRTPLETDWGGYGILCPNEEEL
jgi:hypothetical protein